MKRIFTLLVCLLVLLSAHSQQAGTLDSSFAKKGWTYVDFAQGNINYETGGQVLLQKDGSYIVVFTTTKYLDESILSYTTFTRYFPDGSSDSTFGKGGYADTVHVYQAKAAQQSDGKIVVAGLISDITSSHFGFALAKYNPDGSLDSTFKIKEEWNTEGHSIAIANVAVQGDGKIVLVGKKRFVEKDSNTISYSSDFFVVRYLENGSPDTSFGINGKTTTHFESISEASSLAIQPNGKIVVAGTVRTDYRGPGYGFALARYNANGSLDQTFGKKGKLTTNFQNKAEASLLAIQADGKIIVVGTAQSDFSLVRYNTDGSLDYTFGDKGRVTTDFSEDEETVDEAFSIAIQSDNKIVAAGKSKDLRLDRFEKLALARYNANGSLNDSFGDGGKISSIISQGYVSGDEGEDFMTSGYASSVAIAQSGKIVATGQAFNFESGNDDFILTRYNADGSSDDTFSNDGKLLGYYPNGISHVNSIAIQSDQKIVAAGTISVTDFYSSESNSNSDFALARYNPDGSIDTSFGNKGKITTDFFGRNEDAAAITIQGNGKIVVAGTAKISYSGYNFAVARYNTDGSLDSTFGKGGLVNTGFGPYGSVSANALAIAIQKDQKIVVAGSTGAIRGDFAIARYNADGSLDSTFGINGKVTTDFSAHDEIATTIAIQKDGKLVVGGVVHDDFALARYNADGSLDNTFGNGGNVTTDVLGAYDHANSIVIQNDGKIVLAGSASEGLYPYKPKFTLVRYNNNGSLDSLFGNKGKVITDFGSPSEASSLALQNNGKIIVAGSDAIVSEPYHPYNGDFALARYNHDGSLDSTFGNKGKLTTDFGVSDKASSMAIYKNKVYVAGTDEGFSLRGIIAAYKLGSCTPQTFYRDKDGDGYGNVNKRLWACTAPQGYVADSTDCNDNNASVHPGAKEICGNKIDDNCDGQIDEGCSSLPFLTMHNVTVSEADGIVDLFVSLSKKSDKPVYVFYFTADGTASGFPWREDKDYEAKAGVLVIPAGSQSATVSVKIIKDNLKEGDEYFYLYLLGSFNATIDDNKARITIKDETEPSIQTPLIADALKSAELPEAKLKVKAYPNPSAYSFMLETRSNVNTPLTIRIIDAAGRVVEVMQGVAANSTIQVGKNYLPGIYFAEVLQGKKRIVLKLIKQSK